MSAIETLAARHHESAAQTFEPSLSIIPSLKTMIISCADPRVDPVLVLGLKPGEAAVIRNVGGRITPGALREMALLQEVARAHGAQPGGGFDLIVLHHTVCGITSLGRHPDLLAGYFGIEEADLPTKAVHDPRASVAVDVALLQASPRLPGDWRVSGLVYDVKTGEIEVIVPPWASTSHSLIAPSLPRPRLSDSRPIMDKPRILLKCGQKSVKKKIRLHQCFGYAVRLVQRQRCILLCSDLKGFHPSQRQPSIRLAGLRLKWRPGAAFWERLMQTFVRISVHKFVFS